MERYEGHLVDRPGTDRRLKLSGGSVRRAYWKEYIPLNR